MLLDDCPNPRCLDTARVPDRLSRPILLTRRQLYALAWCKPLDALASEFGMSGRGLRKRYDTAKVPVPGRGHWARINNGGTSHKPALSDELPRDEAKYQFSQTPDLTRFLDDPIFRILARTPAELSNLAEDVGENPTRLTLGEWVAQWGHCDTGDRGQPVGRVLKIFEIVGLSEGAAISKEALASLLPPTQTIDLLLRMDGIGPTSIPAYLSSLRSFLSKLGAKTDIGLPRLSHSGRPDASQARNSTDLKRDIEDFLNSARLRARDGEWELHRDLAIYELMSRDGLTLSEVLSIKRSTFKGPNLQVFDRSRRPRQVELSISARRRLRSYLKKVPSKLVDSCDAMFVTKRGVALAREVVSRTFTARWQELRFRNDATIRDLLLVVPEENRKMGERKPKNNVTRQVASSARRQAIYRPQKVTSDLSKRNLGRPKTREQRVQTAKLLLEIGQPLLTSELVRRLAQIGIVVGGNEPAENLAASLRKYRDVFVNFAGKGFWLRALPYGRENHFPRRSKRLLDTLHAFLGPELSTTLSDLIQARRRATAV